MSKDRNPMTTPAMWGTVFKYPKFLPDAVSIILLGPGVPDWITHKSNKGKKYSIILEIDCLQENYSQI